MKRATITIPDDLEAELNAYLAVQKVRPSLTALIQTALRRFFAEIRLEGWQYRPPSRPLHVTPAASGSGSSDVSVEHDRHLARTG